jgi:hypothetical protein
MTADADRSLGYESLFSRSLTASVAKDLSLAANDCVWNNLLESRIIFSRRSWREKIVFSRQKGGQISIDFLRKALKDSEGLEKTAPNDQYHFLFHRIRGPLKPSITYQGYFNGLQPVKRACAWARRVISGIRLQRRLSLTSQV